MKNLIKRVCLPIMLEKKTRKYFFADACMEMYIMIQSVLSLPVFLNVMLGAYENNDIKKMWFYAVIWFVLSVIFLVLRYRFDILVHGKFYYSTLAEVRQQCIKKLYDESNIQVDKNYDANKIYSFLTNEVEKLVNTMFRLNRFLPNTIVIFIFCVWSITVGSYLSLVAFLGSLFVIIVGNYESKKINQKNKDVFEDKSKIIGKLRSIFVGTESYLVNGKYSKIVKEYETEYSQYVGATVDVANQRAHRSNLTRWMDAIEYLLLIILCYIFANEHSVRIIITMISVYNTMKLCMRRFSDNMIYVVENKYVAEQYEDFLKKQMKEKCNTEDYIFKAENISYKVNGNIILNSIDFEMKENKKIALIGKNGAGKSTFLKILLSVLEPSEGVIKTNQSKSYAYIPVSPQLFPVSIEDNIMYGTSEYETNKLTEIEKAAELIQIGDEQLKELLTEGDENLSGGEAQRVAIARAMMAQGDVLVADEPTANLDIVTAKKVFENIINTSASVLFTTHDPNLLHYADEVYMMEDGRIICSGIYEEICKLDAYKKWECEALRDK